MLINKLESSKSYKENTPLTRRILIDTEKVEWLDHSDYEITTEFVSAAKKLENEKIIGLEWSRPNTIIKRFWLLEDGIAQAYKILGRTSQKDIINSIVQDIEALANEISTEWIKEYLLKQRELLMSKNNLFGLWKEDRGKIRDILTALKGVDCIQGTTVTMRSFSHKFFQDTKYFENDLKQDIIKIAKEYEPELREIENLTDREILQQIGIIKMHETYEFCGNLILNFSSGSLDFSPIKNGACITSNCIPDIISAEIKNTKRILFIENKTNYSEYCLNTRQEDELVILHGGFYSPQHGELFRMISRASGEIPIYFWADIDYGGFKMFVRLKNNCVPNLQPLNMDLVSFNRHKDMLLSRDDSRYFDKLSLLLENTDYEIFRDVIGAIIENRGTVEQEAFLS